MDRGAAVYRRPEEFFALTYPTYNLRELAKDVVHRLAVINDKTIRQLELASDRKPPPEGAVSALRKLLTSISANLKLE